MGVVNKRYLTHSARFFIVKIIQSRTWVDYDPEAELTQAFFATVQNKVHYAIHGHTAAELIVKRADSSQLNMGLTTWEGARVRKSDVAVAKNYLTEEELRALNNLAASNRDCDEISNEIGEMLLSWTFKGGRHQTGWGILERGLCGLAVLALMDGDDRVSKLKSSVATRMLSESAPTQEISDRAASEILERAATLYRQGHWSSRIERAVDQADHEKLRPLLEEIAGLLLSPSVANQTPTA